MTNVLCKKRLGIEKFAGKWVEGRDVWWDETCDAAPAECPCEAMQSEDPLFMLYTWQRTAPCHTPTPATPR